MRAAEQWLAEAGTAKERQPTTLQTEYIIASREAAARRRRITLGALMFGLIVSSVLAVALFARHKAVEQEAKAKNTSVQADFDLALMYRQKSETVDPRVLAHLARALRTSGNARLPRQYLVSLLRDWPWRLPQIEPMRHEGIIKPASFSPDGRRIVTASEDKTAWSRG